jgi:8-hydroxy-5-deazaflavin:NADPH oxidoreductase
MKEEPERIAIIGGTGDQGLGLALRWARAGRSIIIGSRDRGRAESAAGCARSLLGPEARVQGMENAEAAHAASVIVLAVPFAAQLEILKSIKSGFKAGDLLIDVTVPLETAVGGRASRLVGVWAGSAAEQAAQAVPAGVDVVSAFHNVSAAALQDLERPVDSDIIVCGNNAGGKDRVRPLVELIEDCRYVDGGRLENSRIVEAITALLVSINVRYKTHHVSIRVTGLPDSTE